MVQVVEEAYEVPCLMKKSYRCPWTHSWCFDDPTTLVWVMELLCDDDDLVWSLIGYETHEHVLGMMLKPFER